MIQQKTHLKITNNSNTHKILTIKILNRSNHKTTNINNIIIYTIKNTTPNNIIKKNNIIKTIIIHTKSNIHHNNNSYIKFNKNTYIIIHNNKNPHNTHIFKPITHKLHKNNFIKIISLTPKIL